MSHTPAEDIWGTLETLNLMQTSSNDIYSLKNHLTALETIGLNAVIRLECQREYRNYCPDAR